MNQAIYDFTPRIALWSNSIAGIAEGSDVIGRAGGRPAEVVITSDGSVGPTAGTYDLLLVHLLGDDAKLEQIEMIIGSVGADRRIKTIVAARFSQIDELASLVWEDQVELLIDIAPEDLALAVSSAVVPTSDTLHEGRSDDDIERLRQDFSGLIDKLSSYTKGDAAVAKGGFDDIPAETIRTIIRARRMRERYFDSTLFADPAFDMLLDLACAQVEGRKVSVSSLCIASNVPATTALRWINNLVEAGLFVRRKDDHDGRRIFIELSQVGREKIGGYLKAIGKIGAPAL